MKAVSASRASQPTTRSQAQRVNMNANPNAYPSPAPRAAEDPWTAAANTAIASGSSQTNPVGSNASARATPASRETSTRVATRQR